jgi:hypothetical protein
MTAETQLSRGRSTDEYRPRIPFSAFEGFPGRYSNPGPNTHLQLLTPLQTRIAQGLPTGLLPLVAGLGSILGS